MTGVKITIIGIILWVALACGLMVYKNIRASRRP
jgi:hypothetical protein